MLLLNKFFIKTVFTVFFAFILIGCLAEPKFDLSSEKAASVFVGAKKATNLGNTVEISWDAADSSVSEYIVYQIDDKGNAEELGTTTPEILSYKHTGLVQGKIYKYMVKARLQNGSLDANTRVVSTVTFSGAEFLTITGETSASILISTEVKNYPIEEIHVYVEPVDGSSSKVLAKKFPRTADRLDVINLRSGTSYKFYVNLYNSSFGVDGNEKGIVGKTYSEGYKDEYPLDEDLTFRYLNVINAQAYGETLGSPVWPRVRAVRIQYNAFKNSTDATEMRIIRVKKVMSGVQSIDVKTQKLCSSSTDESCIVRCKFRSSDELTSNEKTDLNASDGYLTAVQASSFWTVDSTIKGALPRACIDLDVPAPVVTPTKLQQKFLYTAVLLKRDDNGAYVEELPGKDIYDYQKFKNYLVEVAIPPPNMALVQRDSVNFEICELMGRTSNPINYNSCSYKGPGNVPASVGLKVSNTGGLSVKRSLTQPAAGQNIYDFGYNLMADRFELGCNVSFDNACLGPARADGKKACVINLGMDTTGFTASTQVLRGAALTYLSNTSNVPWLSTVAANTVLYDTASGSCFLVTNPTSRTIFHLAGDPTDSKWNMFSVTDFNKYQVLVTNNPKGEPNIPVPPLAGVSARGGQLACNSFDTAYGRKRVLRRREYFAMAALPRLANEVNSMSLAARQDLLSDNTTITSNPTEQGCNFEDTPIEISPNFASMSASYATANKSYLYSPRAVDYGNSGFKEIIGRDLGFTLPTQRRNYFPLGSTSTRKCTSRYGLQDIIGNRPEVGAEALWGAGDTTWPANRSSNAGGTKGLSVQYVYSSSAANTYPGCTTPGWVYISAEFSIASGAYDPWTCGSLFQHTFNIKFKLGPTSNPAAMIDPGIDEYNFDGTYFPGGNGTDATSGLKTQYNILYWSSLVWDQMYFYLNYTSSDPMARTVFKYFNPAIGVLVRSNGIYDNVPVPDDKIESTFTTNLYLHTAGSSETTKGRTMLMNGGFGNGRYHSNYSLNEGADWANTVTTTRCVIDAEDGL